MGSMHSARWPDRLLRLTWDCTWPAGGNIRLVAALAEGLPVLYNSVVTEVRCSASGAVVRTHNHEFQGEQRIHSCCSSVVCCGSSALAGAVARSVRWPHAKVSSSR